VKLEYVIFCLFDLMIFDLSFKYIIDTITKTMHAMEL
jgi:hypothetical protein